VLHWAKSLALNQAHWLPAKWLQHCAVLGFDFVFDTDFAADLTIMEEGTELLDRLGRHLNGDTTVKVPILTSCCPGWVKFFEHQFPDMIDIPSSANRRSKCLEPLQKPTLQ
jgi:NADP-reducing hydrogenase subunit HndD